MSRKRLIDVEGLLFDDDLVEELGPQELWVYPLLWQLADDWGGYEPKYGIIALKSGALRLSKDQVKAAIEKLIKLGKIIPYTVKGKEYHWIRNFLKHQPLNNPSPPSIPLPPWIVCEEGQYQSGKKYARYSILEDKLPDCPEDFRAATGSLPADHQDTTSTLPVAYR